MLVAVNFHYIRKTFDAPFPSIFGVTPKEFSDQLDILGKTAQFLGSDDICDIIDGTKSLPPKAVVITFDDGFKEQYELAWPILKEKGIPAIFFVNTRPIEENFVPTVHKIHIIRAYTPPERFLDILISILKNRGCSLTFPSKQKAKEVYRYDSEEDAQLKYFLNYVLNETERICVVDQCFEMLGFNERRISKDLYMTKKMVAELAKAGAIGTHGHEHLPLGLQDDATAKRDFDISIQKLHQWTGEKIVSLSYPYGFREACSIDVAEHAQKKNIRFAFTMERTGNITIDAPMFIGRFSNNDVPGGKNCIVNDEEFWTGLKHATWFRTGRK
ncbi:MAG: polysaccharide deacetylase family protein [Methanoregula sp.]|uniref:polysaccharide deacetylase family protein n=1 Tax=Methanoregula sp. TaxID=2052170 RepID=UPI0025F9778C|nr:polysaccharide deacetylase family protein [Methanoregula sp.]MCK9631760.1 polysaccharide deacetylase family protein [Methanoregula sp.]